MAQFDSSVEDTNINKYYESQKSKCEPNCRSVPCFDQNLASLELEKYNATAKSTTYYINTQNITPEKFTELAVGWYENFDEKMGQALHSPENTDNKAKNQTNAATDEGMDYVTFWGTTLSSVALVITFLSANFAGIIIPKTGENLRINVMLLWPAVCSLCILSWLGCS